MLVLTRWLDQAIVINDDILLKITRTKGNTASIGIDAPAQLRIQRAECCEDKASAEPTTSESFDDGE